jgi:hypothetical protein
MKIFAYCSKSAEESARKAAGVEPVTCPPTKAATLDPEQLAGQDFIYFDLHGAPGGTEWRGDKRTIALREAQIREAKLGGAVVFATNCHLGDADSPMLVALLDAGASYVVAGDGLNWAGAQAVMGAARLGQFFRIALAFMDPRRALTAAKMGVQRLSLRNRGMVQDTLGFKLFYRPEAPRGALSPGGVKVSKFQTIEEVEV